ncbi:hypothetical protein ACVWYF_004287 [Hymenobacter sp. UYAg731]
MADKQPIVIVDIPTKVLQQLADLAAQAEALAAPYLIPLTTEQRKKRLKMGPKSVDFVTKTFNFTTATPAFAPGFVDVPGLGTNLATVAGLDPVAARFANLGYSLESTNMVASGSAQSAGLLIYNRVQEAADNNQPGAQPVFNELKTQFERTKQEPKPAKA